MKIPGIVSWFFCAQNGVKWAVNGHFKVLTIHLCPYEREEILLKKEEE